MMDSARQVVRWSIPGWVFVFLLCLQQGVENIMIHGSFSSAVQNSVLQQMGPGAAAVLVIAGVPLGFLLNQFYYALYWNWMPFDVAARDRGGDALRNLSPVALAKIAKYHPIDVDAGDMVELSRVITSRSFFPILVFGREFPRLKAVHQNDQDRGRYREARKKNFEAARFYLTLMCRETGLVHFKQEYTSLSDLYHSIGASLIATVGAMLAYLAYHGAPSKIAAMTQPIVALSILINLMGMALIIRALQATRKTTFLASQAILQSAIRWYGDVDTARTARFE